jgi:hypothetical protein
VVYLKTELSTYISGSYNPHLGIAWPVLENFRFKWLQIGYSNRFLNPVPPYWKLCFILLVG